MHQALQYARVKAKSSAGFFYEIKNYRFWIGLRHGRLLGITMCVSFASGQTRAAPAPLLARRVVAEGATARMPAAPRQRFRPQQRPPGDPVLRRSRQNPL